MLGIFLVLLILSIVVSLGLRFIFPNKFTNTETGLMIAGTTLAGAIMLAVMSFSASMDVDILNGQVTSKEMERVSCEHSYSCNCRTVTSGSGSNRTTSTECDTCYEHFYDQDWEVHTSIGTFLIDRVDRQGLREPKRYTQVQKADPVSKEERVRNYVLASPDSLFNTKELSADELTYGKWLPTYNHIYDYYKFDHVMDMGTGVDVVAYNKAVANVLRVIGAAKQANIIMVFVPTDDRNYKEALERHWLGGKKNDIVVIVGVAPNKAITWADAFTFGKSSGNELLVIKIRQSIEAINDVSKVDDIVNSINSNVYSYFTREHMSKYEYLQNDYTPSTTAVVVVLVIYAILFAGLITFFWINDIRIGGSSNNRFTGYYSSSDISKMLSARKTNLNKTWRK